MIQDQDLDLLNFFNPDMKKPKYYEIQTNKFESEKSLESCKSFRKTYLPNGKLVQLKTYEE